MEQVKKICWIEKQNFIDCMFINSDCVQSGRLSFDECMQEDVPKNCSVLLNAYLKCRLQLVFWFDIFTKKYPMNILILK